MIKGRKLATSLIIILVSISCNKNPSETVTPYNPVILSKDVIIINELDDIEFYSVDAAGVNYTFTITGTEYDTSEAINIGDIIVGTERGGYIRRVNNVLIYPERLILRTEYATLTDAVLNAYVDTSIHLGVGQADKSGKDGFKLVSAAKGVELSEYGINLSGLELFDGSTGGVDVQVQITNGSISFDPWLDNTIGIDTRGVRKFNTIVHGDFDYEYDMLITSNGKFGMSGQVNLAEFEHSTVQMIGRLPLVEVISLDFDIGFEVSATIDGSFTCGTKAELELKAGAKYENDEWTEIWEQKGHFGERPLDWPGEGETHVFAYIKPSISVSYYTVPSSHITIRPFVSFDGEIATFPSWCWQLMYGIKGTVSQQLNKFSYQALNYSDNFAEITWPISSNCETVDDLVSPSTITDLLASNPAINTISLSWTATGDDGDYGKASQYDLRYSTSSITSSNWNMATQFTGEPNPKYAGYPETFLATNLTPNTTYYFAIKVADEVGNWSEISNIASESTTPAIDVTPPSAVTDLFAGEATSTSITLTWTAPGDDGTSGTASKYDIRFSTVYINSSNWNTAVSVPHLPDPQPAGFTESVVVPDLSPGTIYFFVLKSTDEVLNWSALSNMAGAKTLSESDKGVILGEIPSPAPSYTMDITGQASTLWVIDQLDNFVYEIDPANGSVEGQFEFSPDEWASLQGIAWDGVYLWIASRSRIFKVDPMDGSEAGYFLYDQSFPLVTGLSWGDGRLWAAGPLVDIAYEIDVETALAEGHCDNAITNQVTFSEPSRFRGILFHDNRLYISSWTNAEQATLFEIDAVTGEEIDAYDIQEFNPYPHNPLQGGLATDGVFLYAGGDNGRILKIKF